MKVGMKKSPVQENRSEGGVIDVAIGFTEKTRVRKAIRKRESVWGSAVLG